MYAALSAFAIIAPYLETTEMDSLFRGLLLAGAYCVFLILHSLTRLSESTHLNFARLGVVGGETVLAMLYLGLFAPLEPALRSVSILVTLLVALEHGPKLGLFSAICLGAFNLWQGGFHGGTLIVTCASFAAAAIPVILDQAEVLRRQLRGQDEFNQLDKAYHIARRETTKRHENEQELYQERRRFEGLVDIAQGLVQIREQEQLLQRIVDVATDQLNARGALVLLLQDGKLRARTETGLSAMMVQAIEQATEPSVLKELFRSGAPLHYGVGDELPELGIHRAILKRFSHLLGLDGERRPADRRVDQLLAVPLASAQDRQAFGLLFVLNHTMDHSFTEAEAKYLQVLSTNSAVALKNILFTAELERSHWELIQALAQAIEAKDSYTSNHVGRVRDISVEIARTIGLDRDAIKVIAISATLHDVGKISTPDSVLLKPGPLTDEEYEIMKQHAENGAQILRGILSLPEGVEPMVRHHHERWDGKGYPQGIQGAQIPLGAQIISIADCFDAMTYDRPYRKGFPVQEALKRMEMGCGTQFNPKLLCAFFAIQGYVPETEPSAISTYHDILGKLRLGTHLGEGVKTTQGIPGGATGSSGEGREPMAKPLLLERN